MTASYLPNSSTSTNAPPTKPWEFFRMSEEGRQIRRKPGTVCIVQLGAGWATHCVQRNFETWKRSWWIGWEVGWIGLVVVRWWWILCVFGVSLSAAKLKGISPDYSWLPCGHINPLRFPGNNLLLAAIGKRDSNSVVIVVVVGQTKLFKAPFAPEITMFYDHLLTYPSNPYQPTTSSSRVLFSSSFCGILMLLVWCWCWSAL